MTDIEQALDFVDCSSLQYTEWVQVGMWKKRQRIYRQKGVEI